MYNLWMHPDLVKLNDHYSVLNSPDLIGYELHRIYQIYNVIIQSKARIFSSQFGPAHKQALTVEWNGGRHAVNLISVLFPSLWK